MERIPRRIKGIFGIICFTVIVPKGRAIRVFGRHLPHVRLRHIKWRARRLETKFVGSSCIDTNDTGIDEASVKTYGRIPTGAYFRRLKRAKLLRLCRESDALVVEEVAGGRSHDARLVVTSSGIVAGSGLVLQAVKFV
jgi:hypothetical protein